MTYGYILWSTVKMFFLIALGLGSGVVMTGPLFSPMAWWWAPIGATGFVIAISLVMYGMWGDE